LRCPHSPTFVGSTTVVSEYSVRALPALPLDSLETLVFASVVCMQIAAVAIAKSHADYDLVQKDPLRGQEDLEVDPSISLVDFTSLEASIGKRTNKAIEDFVASLTATENNDLRINNVLRSTLLHEDGAVNIEFSDLDVGENGDLAVSLEILRLSGLDTISSISILDAIGTQTIRNEVSWDRLGVEFVVSLVTSEKDLVFGNKANTRENITFSLELAEIDMKLVMLLAIDRELLGSLQLASDSDVKHILPCLLSAARAANLTELDVSVGSIQNISVHGFLSSELSGASSSASRAIIDNYGELLLSAMPSFFDSTVRTLLNNWIQHYMGELAETTCQARYPIVQDGYATSSLILFAGLAVIMAVALVSIGGMIWNQLVVTRHSPLEGKHWGLSETATKSFDGRKDEERAHKP
jgi:hypothetical protein